ncbi:MAG: class I SAM-dependent methyltransferase, partial [Sulfurimonadaceae bacterium]|nr:class I SAM-dependent methyltransferase [Sulfurimonadaceae bacterium]
MILSFFETLELPQDTILSLLFYEEEVLRYGYSSFIDIAQLHQLQFLTPIANGHEVTLGFRKLNSETSFHNESEGNEKYGANSTFFTIEKNNKFSFLYNYQKALQFCGVKRKKRILNLGVNRADEFVVIEELLKNEIGNIEFVGVDYSASAIEVAKQRFPHENFHFYAHDIKELQTLDIGRFDLIISIGTLQSSNLNFNATLMDIYQNLLAENGSMILGFPNCRWIDGEMIYGAKTPNYSFSEMGLLVKDIHFCKKYLQQKKYRVLISGKDYI